MAFAQLTYRESLRDIEACLRSCPDKLYHMGIRCINSRVQHISASLLRAIDGIPIQFESPTRPQQQWNPSVAKRKIGFACASFL